MKDFLLSISAVSVIMAAVWLLIPKGSMQKSVKYALGIFALVGIISAFGKIEISLPEVTETSKGAELSYDIAVASAERAVENSLIKNNISAKKVTAVTDNLKSDSINITKVVLELESDKDFEKAAELVFSETGLISECE